MNAPTRTRIPVATPPAQNPVAVQDLPLDTPMPDTSRQVSMVHQPVQKMYPPKIAAALLKITREINAVEKRGENTFHHYKYPKWEDVLAELGPKMTANGILITQHEIQASGLKENMLAITYQFTIISEDGDVWPDRIEQTSICKMQDHKGILDDKAASKCHTQGQKYFLMGLFKVRTRDMQEADHDGDGKIIEGNGKRIVPSATGKLPPHEIKTIEGDTASTWSARFIEAINTAETEAEIGKWDVANDAHIQRLMEMVPVVYNKVVEAIEARKVAILKPKQAEDTKPTEQQPEKKKRAPRPSRAKPKADVPPAEVKKEETAALPPITDDERDWLLGLGGAFSGAEDMQTLQEEQARLMTPYKEQMSEAAWNEADSLYAEHVERITGEGA